MNVKRVTSYIPKVKLTKRRLLIAVIILLMTVGLIISYIAEQREKAKIYVEPENVTVETESKNDDGSATDFTAAEDYYISRDYLNFLKQYPWYIYIPIDKPDYFISYDFEKQQFKIRLKINRGSSQQTVDRLTQQAIKDINMIGASTERYGYYILFQDD